MQNHYRDEIVVTLIPGDGIGPEITQATKEVIHALDVNITWEEHNAGLAVYQSKGILVPEEIYTSFEKNKVALKGPITTPIGTGFRSINVELRKRYDLFACVRPIQSIGNVPSHYHDINIVLFRENTEDLYMGLEEKISNDEARSIKVITRSASKRIALAAFDYAIQHNRKKVTVVTKANIMKLSDGLFLDTVRDVSKSYPSIEFTEILVDNMCMQMVLNPNQFDVIVTENLYGDILSDLGAALVGGLGFVPGANIGVDKALFEATHGSAPDIAGLGTANPTAMLLSASLMLDYLNYSSEANLLRYSINNLYQNKENFTKDIKGPLDTKAYTQKLIMIIQELKGEFYAKK